MSQPAREFIVKIIELSLWSSDILLGHLLLFLLTLPMMIPRRPSQQIRAPIMIKYGIIYGLTIILFIALIALPIIFESSLRIHSSCTLCHSI
ncbi:hypothetical protein DFH08DRAFT_885100 [Mycena albidolilacea]|uniref:Uncharacterized protein n=1 Tax=Mycena albidolilacea TaxID=1033008 RepID=A0AAD6ZK24_9AGAR|nr:hypothetical protein DFH08DRAFT_885100 [Mycena albidolilacea]